MGKGGGRRNVKILQEMKCAARHIYLLAPPDSPLQDRLGDVPPRLHDRAEPDTFRRDA
jgi:hypothetical protein